MSHHSCGPQAIAAPAADITDQPTMLAWHRFPLPGAAKSQTLLNPRTPGHHVMTSPRAEEGGYAAMRQILVTSASGANGDGYGTLLSSAGGELAREFSDDPRITDPRGLSLSPAVYLLVQRLA